MPIFQYSARSELGVDIKGALFAPNEELLYQMLRKQGLFLLQCQMRSGRSEKPHRLRIPAKQVLAFTIHVSTFQQAGISLMQSFSSLAREPLGVKFQCMVEGIINQISGGSSFSEALAQYPRIFDRHYIQMVAAGESAGQLDARMEELVAHLEWQQELRAQVKQSSTYPLFLVGLLSAVIVLLMTFTLPQFITLLTQFHAKLPMPTRIVMGISDAFSKFWYLLPLIPAIPYAVYRVICRTPAGQFQLDRFKLKIPIFGSVYRKIAISQFAHHFSCLQAAGIETISSIRIVEELVGNRVISGALEKVRHGIEAGKSMSHIFAQSNEFPTLVVQMLTAGEESGNMESTLKKVAQYYDKEIPASIKKAFTIVEPLVLVVMGGLVAFIALAILLPIYEFGTAVNK
jgi:type IV pilus assembly protein PilC